MKKCAIYFLAVLCCGACKLSSIGKEAAVALKTSPSLGAVGVFEKEMMAKHFSEVALPELSDKIRLSVDKRSFSRKSLRQFNKQAILKNRAEKAGDSVSLESHFFELKIIDQVGVIDALNNTNNQSLRGFLEETGNNSILTSIWLYFPPSVSGLFENAAQVYLVNNKKNFYTLEVLSQDGTTKNMHFGEGDSFGYGFSDFCWKENYRKELVIAAFRERGESCPGNTEEKAQKVVSEDVFDKL